MWFSYAWKEVCVLESAYRELSLPLLLLVACYPEHLNIVDEQASLLPMVLLGEKVVVHQALIALLLPHHSYRHLPPACRMTENQGLVETTFGTTRCVGQANNWRDAILNWILGPASKCNSHVMQTPKYYFTVTDTEMVNLSTYYAPLSNL